MVKAGVVALVLLVAGGAAAAQDTRYAGEWTGNTFAGQGVTAIRLVVVSTGSGGAPALAHFFPTPEQRARPSADGCPASKAARRFLTHEPVSRLMPPQCAVASFQARGVMPGSPIVPEATSRFQMNSTSSAPKVAAMKPAP